MDPASVIEIINSYSASGIPAAAGFALGIAFPVILALLIARFRGFWASLFFPLFIAGMVGFLFFDIASIQTVMTGNDFLYGLYTGFACYYVPFAYFHELFVSALSKIAPDSDFYVNKILNTGWFTFTPYAVLFVIFFLFTHKKSSRHKRRVDDDF